MRFLASIRYDGSKYYGFQKLKTEKTIQNELEKALTKINKSDVFVKGAGRTDRGAHAYSQMVHFDLDINITAERIKRAVNAIIDSGIYVNYCKEVDCDFHARFCVKEKTYDYIVNLLEYDPIKNSYVYNYNRGLNIRSMKRASRYLLGEHSYKAFVSGHRENYDSGIKAIKFFEKSGELTIRFIGKNFYQYMVRNLVGALILVGENKITSIQLKEMLDKEENLYNYSTVPATGLYLKDIKY